MKKKLKHIHNKSRNYVYDSGICMGRMTNKLVEEELAKGFIKSVKGYSNVYQTDMSYIK